MIGIIGFGRFSELMARYLATVMDVCSVKEYPVRLMRESANKILDNPKK
jgi:hypothetical protein